ncbi:MAG TPA: V-type ATPase 116kDa subunit family protein [Candidatus Nanopelagicaceae bacterium]|nr:V-type ATPase 116kDa subunit family protein [Candidatus Nanopelagicaceae bacterium]
MPWRESLTPIRMERVALVSPEQRRHSMLVQVARSAVVELDLPYSPGDGPEELDRAADAAIISGPTAGLVGWMPTDQLSKLAEALAPIGGAIVRLAMPRGVQPPTLISGKSQARTSRMLVDTYGTVPYADVDPSRLAGLSYVVMFGMMFGDVGQGAMLVLAGLLFRSGRYARLEKLKKIWRFVVGAGLASMFFGALYGEAFGPTGLVPVLWLEPMSNPIELLLTALFFGAFLLAGAYVLGVINRVREGGWGYALYARSGIAGSLLFVGLGLLALGINAHASALIATAIVLALLALALIFVGLYIEAGGGGTGVMEAAVELVDTVIRLGSNVVSFARLAAFGLTHAALMLVVWNGTAALWAPNWRGIAAVLVFVLGNILTFALEALVAGIQALRLEYYELFSRVFQSEGRPFRPWAPVLDPTEDLDASAAEQTSDFPNWTPNPEAAIVSKPYERHQS